MSKDYVEFTEPKVCRPLPLEIKDLKERVSRQRDIILKMVEDIKQIKAAIEELRA